MKAPMVVLSIVSFVLSAGCAQHSWESIQWSEHVIRNCYMAEAQIPPEDIAAVLKTPGLGGSSYRLNVWIWNKEDHQLILIGPSAQDVQAAIRLEPCTDGRMRIRTFTALDWMEYRIIQRAIKQFARIEEPMLYDGQRQGDQTE